MTRRGGRHLAMIGVVHGYRMSPNGTFRTYENSQITSAVTPKVDIPSVGPSDRFSPQPGDLVPIDSLSPTESKIASCTILG